MNLAQCAQNNESRSEQIHHNNAFYFSCMRGSTTLANAMNMLFINSQTNLMIVVENLFCVDLLFFENIKWDRDETRDWDIRFAPAGLRNPLGPRKVHAAYVSM